MLAGGPFQASNIWRDRILDRNSCLMPLKVGMRSFQCALIGAIRKMIYDCSSELDLESQAKK